MTQRIDRALHCASLHDTVYSTRCWKNKLMCVLRRRLDLARLHRRSREKLNHTPIAQFHHLIIPSISSCAQETSRKSGWENPPAALSAADMDSGVPHYTLYCRWVSVVKVTVGETLWETKRFYSRYQLSESPRAGGNKLRTLYVMSHLQRPETTPLRLSPVPDFKNF